MKKQLATIALIGISLSTIFAQELVKDIYPNADDSDPETFTKIGDKLFFSAYTPTEGRELWVSNGTAAGTSMVKDINPGVDNGINTEEIIELNGKAIFSADNGTQGEELWVSDGTAAGTVMIKEIHGAPTASNGSHPRYLTKMGDEIFFNASNEISGVYNEELWKTDGTAAGTVLVKEINPSSRSRPQFLTEMNGKLYFNANDGSGEALWATDGTEAGTVLIKSNSSGASFSPSEFIQMGDELIFSAHEDATNNELWKTDGTTSGTVLVKDIATGSVASSNAGEFVMVGDILYFRIDDNEIWKTNGTATGTEMVADGFTGIFSKMSFRDALYFVAQDGLYGKEIYVLEDGSSAQLLKDINQNSSSGVRTNPFFEVHGSTLFFSATSSNNNDYTLWQTDGTTAGTIAVPTAPNSLIEAEEKLSFGNKLYFVGVSDIVGGTGTELWVFDNLSSTTIEEEACPSYTYEGIEYTETGDYDFTYTNTLGYDSVVTLKLTICGNVAISNLQEFEVSIFPNPVGNVLNINTEKDLTGISLLNTNGAIVKSFDPSLNSFDVAGISQGMYFLEVKSAEKKSVIKIIKR